ncbi:putative hemolysin [Parelusimicrobium proximum]|uniref:hemolysin family protein n=1 Tax=Parelusimicrobium proximum TaxID=3228953 RepID=UPI003D16F28D
MVILVIILMLLLNALLAAYEMALASVSKTKLTIFAQENRQGAHSALFMKEHIEGSLAVVQIGISLVGAGAAAVGGASAGEAVAPKIQEWLTVSKSVANTLSVIVVVVPLSFITIVFAELTPKTFAIKNNEFVVLLLSPVMRVLYTLLSPIVKVMEGIVNFLTQKEVSRGKDAATEKKAAMEDLRTAAAIASSSRLFGKMEERIVMSSAFFSMRTIREIQVPIDQVYMLYADDTISDTLIKAHLDMHTRFPVCEREGDAQSIIGYFNFKDIFLSTKTTPGQITTTRSIMRPITKLDGSMMISTALQKMMREHQHIALVMNGQIITGIITLEDIFEEMVGEIEDEYDFFPVYIRRFGSSIIASAGAKMADVYKELGLQAPANLIKGMTVEQWTARELCRLPASNDKITADGLRMETRKFRRKQMVEAVFMPAPAED